MRCHRKEQQGDRSSVAQHGSTWLQLPARWNRTKDQFDSGPPFGQRRSGWLHLRHLRLVGDESTAGRVTVSSTPDKCRERDCVACAKPRVEMSTSMTAQAQQPPLRAAQRTCSPALHPDGNDAKDRRMQKIVTISSIARYPSAIRCISRRTPW